MIDKIMIKKLKSKYNYNETIEKLKETIEKYGWTVSAEHNMEEKVGKPIYIVELCNKNHAKTILDDEMNFWVSAMMPCRIGVCKEEDSVYLYGMNMKLMAKFLTGNVGKIFKKVAEEEEKILKELVE